MHQRSVASHTRHWLSGFLSLLLVSGCLPSPTKAPTGAKSGLQVAGKPAASPSASAIPSSAPIGNSLVPTLPIEVKAPIISHNGGNFIQGAVMAPANIISHNGGNIISHNGGNIISHNGGNVVTNGGGNIISHNGGNIIGNNGSGFKISQVPLAYTTVRLKDAAGNPVKDDKGNELVTKTDENGNYKFPVDVKGRNLVVHAEVPGQKADLVALLPKEGVTAETQVSVDMASTLTLSYILELYVKGDLATFEKLPRDLTEEAQKITEEAIVGQSIALPESLESEKVIATVAIARRTNPKVNEVFERVRRVLIVAGIRNEGNGLRATEVPLGEITGLTTDLDGNVYLFSPERHTLWKISTDGVLHTIVASGAWGYSEPENSDSVFGWVSGLTFDIDGSLLLADTFNHRIVRINHGRTVSVVAGQGLPGFAGDGGDAQMARLSYPCGLSVDLNGNIYVSDSGNHRIRKISIDGKISTVAGNGKAEYSGDGGPAISASLSHPQGLVVKQSGEIVFADFGNNKLRLIGNDGRISSVESKIARGSYRPNGVSIDENGEIYIRNLWDSTIERMKGDETSAVDTSKYSGEGYDRSINLGSALHSSMGKLFLEDDNSIFVLSPNLSVTLLAGASSKTWREKNFLSNSKDLTVDEKENVYIISNRRIIKIVPDGTESLVAGNGEPGGYVWLAGRRDEAYVDLTNNATEVTLGDPNGIALARDNSILFADNSLFGVVRKVSNSGVLQTIAGNGMPPENSQIVPNGNAKDLSLEDLYDVVQLPDERIIVSGFENSQLLQMTTDGRLSQLTNLVRYPRSLSVDSRGNLCFIDKFDNIRRIATFKDGMVETLVDSGTLFPEVSQDEIFTGLAFDRKGNLYVSTETKVVKYSSSKLKTIIAGVNGVYLNGTTKDDSLTDVQAIHISPAGHLYILEATQLKKITSAQLAEH